MTQTASANTQAIEPLKAYLANPANSYLGYAQETLASLERGE